MKLLFSFLSIALLSFNVCAKELKQTASFQTSGGVTDMVIDHNKLYAATTASSVDVFDISTQKMVQKIKLPQIKDFIGDIIDAKIYSVDVLNKKVLIVSQGEKGGRNIDLFINNKRITLIPDTKRYFVAKAKFVNEHQILFSLLSNQLYLFDIKSKKSIYVKQISQSKFSDFVLDEEKKRAIITDESGNIHLVDVANGNELQTYANQNLDNVFQLDWKQGIILTAGQDRRSVVYDSKGNAYFRKSGFLIYSCGLSPTGTIGAYSSDEENNVTVFNTRSNKELCKLTNNHMTLTKILFKNEKEIFVASDDKIINYYKID
jgi:WD40 repeat protein